MELDDLKTIWKEANVTHGSDQMINADEIKALIHKKSNTSIVQVKRSMRFKIIMLSISGIIALIFAVVPALPFIESSLFLEAYLSILEISIMFFVMSLVTLGIAISHLSSYKRIAQFEKSSAALKNTLVNILDILKGVTKLAIYSDLFVSPLVVGYVVYAALSKQGALTFEARLGYVLIIAAFMVVFSYFSNKWAMKRKFGDQIKQLKANLEELESLEHTNGRKDGHSKD